MEFEMSLVEVDGPGWRWVHGLVIPVYFEFLFFSGSVKIFRLLFTSLKLCKTLLSSIVVYRELLLI